MKFISILFIAFVFVFDATGQNDEMNVTKDSIVGTWRICGPANIDETLDTLVFQKPTPNCRDEKCSENNWSFRKSGTVEFIITNGCSNGFHSVSKAPKRWLFIQKDNMIKMITNDGWVEYYEIIRFDDKLVLVHRFDIEN